MNIQNRIISLQNEIDNIDVIKCKKFEEHIEKIKKDFKLELENDKNKLKDHLITAKMFASVTKPTSKQLISYLSSFNDPKNVITYIENYFDAEIIKEDHLNYEPYDDIGTNTFHETHYIIYFKSYDTYIKYESSGNSFGEYWNPFKCNLVEVTPIDEQKEIYAEVP